jgi:hypothetical protein
MSKIEKEITIYLEQEEIDSPLPIVIDINVCDRNGDCVTYTITYPKNNE